MYKLLIKNIFILPIIIIFMSPVFEGCVIIKVEKSVMMQTNSS